MWTSLNLSFFHPVSLASWSAGNPVIKFQASGCLLVLGIMLPIVFSMVASFYVSELSGFYLFFSLSVLGI